MTTPNPIPTAVADLKVRQMSPRVRQAVLAEADAKRAIQQCRTPLTAEAREYAIAGITAARKVLATVPTHGGAA